IPFSLTSRCRFARSSRRSASCFRQPAIGCLVIIIRLHASPLRRLDEARRTKPPVLLPHAARELAIKPLPVRELEPLRLNLPVVEIVEERIVTDHGTERAKLRR